MPNANTPITDTHRARRLDPSLLTLTGRAFDDACAELMRLVETAYTPTLIVGVRTGGFVVAESMVRAARVAPPLLPLTSRRVGTSAKSRLPLLRTALGILPQPVLDVLRRAEHRYVIARRVNQARRQEIDRAEADTIAAHLAARPPPRRILVADDAVDSGVTLTSVLELLREVCPADTEFRSAAITQTLVEPIVTPDYVLFHGTLCRFPWSFDAAG